MATITAADVKNRFTAFSAVSDSVISDLITDTKCKFNITAWGDCYKRAHSLYVAHLLALDSMRNSGDSGPKNQISSKSVDGVSVSFGGYTPTSMDEAFLASTSYGQEYLALLANAKVTHALLV